MGKSIQAIRGMNDILPSESNYWLKVEETLRNVALSYGYQEIRTPVVELTDLFVRSIGNVTDIVEKEMYTFLDRSGASLTLRPEGTASCVRAGIEHGLLYHQVQRLYYLGPMFRYERPQKDRYRQFHQFGVETYGLSGPDIDAEILLLSRRIWEELKIQDKVTLQLNSLGNESSRAAYKTQLVKYFSDNVEKLDEDCKRRLHSNPLRILDSKNPDLQQLIALAPKITDCLDEVSAKHFKGLSNLLDAVGLQYTINPRLVRGLDYYGLTVFEWVTNSSGAQNAVCGGGHYDNLVCQMGGNATPAVGFAIGMERLVSLVKLVDEKLLEPMSIYFVMLGDEALLKGLKLAENLRRELPKVRVIVNAGGGNLGTQLKRADKSGAHLAFILGENELLQNCVSVKYLRKEVTQQQVSFDQLINFCNKELI